MRKIQIVNFTGSLDSPLEEARFELAVARLVFEPSYMEAEVRYPLQP